LALLKEIDSALRGTYVNNVYSYGTSQLLRLRKPGSPDSWLVVSPRKGVWISESVAERGETSDFTTKLRGELERSRLVGASQVDLDRVFELEFENGGKKKLVVELMPPGNVIVVGSDDKVLLASDEVRSRTRRVVKGEDYRPPAQGRLSPTAVTPEDVNGMWNQEKIAGRAIGRHVALPRKYVSESLRRLGLSDGSPASSLGGREEEVVSVFRGLVDEARDAPKPCICRTEEGEEIFVIPPTDAEVTFRAKSVSELCDREFLREMGEKEKENVPSPDETKRKELEITISKLKAEADSLAAKAAKVRSEAASAAAAPIEDALRILRDSGVRRGREPGSPSAVASVLFDDAKELERKSAESLVAAGRLERQLAKVRPVEARRAKPLPRRRGEWYEKFRWFFTSGGKLAIGGRDAQSNSLLVRRHLSEGDVVYHADLFGSPFFVLKEGKLQSEQEQIELAQATVSFSSGWKTGLGAADAYWVEKDQVSAAAGSGEYLAKGSFVIRGKKNLIRHALLQVAVGIDQGGRVMAGPESAVAKACSRYVVLTPHREKQTDTAKKVMKELRVPGSQAQSLDDFVRSLPAGGGKIVRRKAVAIGSG